MNKIMETGVRVGAGVVGAGCLIGVIFVSKNSGENLGYQSGYKDGVNQEQVKCLSSLKYQKIGSMLLTQAQMDATANMVTGRGVEQALAPLLSTLNKNRPEIIDVTSFIASPDFPRMSASQVGNQNSDTLTEAEDIVDVLRIYRQTHDPEASSSDIIYADTSLLGIAQNEDSAEITVSKVNCPIIPTSNGS